MLVYVYKFNNKGSFLSSLIGNKLYYLYFRIDFEVTAELFYKLGIKETVHCITYDLIILQPSKQNSKCQHSLINGVLYCFLLNALRYIYFLFIIRIIK